MASPVAHTMISSKDKSSTVIGVEIFDELSDLLDTLIDDLDVVQILLRVWSVRMASGIDTEQMKEKDDLVLAKGIVEGLVRSSLGEEVLDMVENPVIEIGGILREVLEFMPIRKGIDPSWNSAMLEHGQNVRTAPTPGVSAAVENAIEVDRVHLPACRNGRDILVEAGNEGDMAGTRFGRNTGVGNAEASMF